MKVLSQDNVFREFDGVKVSFNNTRTIHFDNGSKIECTDDHILYNSELAEVKACELKVGDKIYTNSGSAVVVRVEHNKSEFVYDLVNVRDTHNYIANGGVLSHQCLYIDEFAHIDNDVEFYTSTYPVISSGKSTQVIITSTPKGLNLFYKLWSDAIEGRNNFKTLGYDWTVVPGRDEKWREETIENTSPVQFAQEYECAFQGSSNTLIAGWKLQQLTFKTPIESLSDKHWSVYEPPNDDHSYCMTVDVAEGLGQDYAVVSIFDVTAMPYKLVAVYRNNLIQPVFLTEVVYRAGKRYNNAYTLVENNSIGKIVADSLFFDFEYENLFRTTSKHGETDIGFGGHQPGIRTTAKTKALGCAQLKSLVESDSLIVEDYNAVSELSTFSVKGKSYAAEKGKTDDVVMTLVLFAWFTAQPYFSDMFDIDVRKQLRDSMDLDSNIGFMFIDDGVTDYENMLDTI